MNNQKRLMQKLAILLSGVMIYEACALPLAQAEALSQAELSVHKLCGPIG